MKILLALAALAVLAGGTAAFADDKSELKPGDKAPDFKLKGTNGKEYTLGQFKGKQAVVIAWFPKADTPG